MSGVDRPVTLAEVLTPVAGGSPEQPDAALERASYTLHVADGWQQGRGAFGGLVLGALARAIETSEGAGSRRLRSLTGELPGPVPVGESAIHVAALRRGSGMSTWHARLERGGEVLAAATAVLGKSRVPELARASSRKRVTPPWQEVPVAPVGPPLAPAFTQHFELRPTGPLPFSGASGELRCEGFVRVRPDLAPARLGAAELIALADTYWPTFLAGEPGPRPAATVSFALQVLQDPAELDPAIPLFHQARELGHADGFVCELRELFTPEGALVAVNLQTFAIIK